MKLKLQRYVFGNTYTIGKLYIDGNFYCYTLEDKIRDVKVYGETAIPTGTYKVIITYSNRFKKDLPLLIDVPGYEGVRIHSGNSSKDTEGCILLGSEWTKGDWITNSRKAFDGFFDKLKQAKGEVTIEVV